MPEVLATILGIFFVLLDVSVLPVFARGFIVFDFSLFYINAIVSTFKEKAFIFLCVLVIFKSFFLLGCNILPLFFLYTLSVLTLFLLERVLNVESIILQLIISVLFLFVEVTMIGLYDFKQVISALLIHLVLWIFLANMLQNLFKKLRAVVKENVKEKQ